MQVNVLAFYPATAVSSDWCYQQIEMPVALTCVYNFDVNTQFPVENAPGESAVCVEVYRPVHVPRELGMVQSWSSY